MTSVSIATKQILFIDDEPEFAGPHMDGLRDAGYDVTHAGTAREAKVLLEQNDFDLIVLDLIMLPGDTDEQSDERFEVPSAEIGLNLHKHIRSLRKFSKVPIVFFTVVSDADTRDKIRDRESNLRRDISVVNKPALPSRLLSRVRDAIGE